MKPSELTGAALDWVVAKCMGQKVTVFPGAILWTGTGYGTQFNEDVVYSPSSYWEQAGPIIEQEGITVCPNTRPVMSKGNCAYRAHPFDPEGEPQYGPTALVAAMRCFVSSKLGEEVDVPKELL